MLNEVDGWLVGPTYTWRRAVRSASLGNVPLQRSSVGAAKLMPSGGWWTVYVAGTSRWLTISPASAPSFGSGGIVGPGVVVPGADEPGVAPPLGTVGPGPADTELVPESVRFKITVVRPNPMTSAATTRQTMSTVHWLRFRPGGSATGSGLETCSTGGRGAIVSRSGSAYSVKARQRRARYPARRSRGDRPSVHMTCETAPMPRCDPGRGRNRAVLKPPQATRRIVTRTSLERDGGPLYTPLSGATSP